MTLRVAFAKGRGASDAMRLMELSGVHLPSEMLAGKLTVHRAPEHGIDAFVVRGDDITTLLKRGVVDVAIASSIAFEEHESSPSRSIARLPIAECHLSFIVPDSATSLEAGTVYTRYPRVCRRRLESSSWKIEAWHGCVEAAIFLGIGDAIVDIVETGWTLRTLGLREVRVLCDVAHEIRICHDRVDALERMRTLMPTVRWI